MARPPPSCPVAHRGGSIAAPAVADHGHRVGALPGGQPSGVCRARRPHASPLYGPLDRDERFAPTYGPWRAVIDACAHEYLLAFSCKNRHFCGAPTASTAVPSSGILRGWRPASSPMAASGPTAPSCAGAADRPFALRLARCVAETAALAGRTARTAPGFALASPRLALIGLRAPGAIDIHRRVVRVGDDHLVAERLLVARHPLALRARLEQNSRAWPVPKHGREPLPARDDASLLRHRPVLRFDRQLALAPVQIQAYDVVGGRPPGVRPVVTR